MSRYRVTCNMRSEREWGKVFPVSAEGKHPDIVKQMLLSLYPKHIMENISIADLTPIGKPWHDNAKPEKEKRKAVQSKNGVDLDLAWRKELAR